MHSDDNSNGYILYEDTLRVVIATGFETPSDNGKTGPMIQVYILVKGVDPLTAADTGLDSLVCGDCVARGLVTPEGVTKRWCYVNQGQAPLGIWRAFVRGSYRLMKVSEYERFFRGRKVRFGAYGDPVYIPFRMVRVIVSLCAGHTGYTHQWRNMLFAAYREFFMASVEDIAGKHLAESQGWRTFRASESIDADPNEIQCPFYTRGIQCADCLLCAGNAKPAKSIVLEVHGSGAVHFGAKEGN